STAKLLARYPDLGGIYIGTSNSSAVCRRVTEMGMQGRVKIVASDLFDELRVNIQNGVAQATIFQDPYAQGRQAFKRLYEYISEAKESGESVLIKPQAVFKSNLDLF
ncbi:MAG: substrate-binding domain-containing protein, partial [Clostridia bacterium]|nr:substrate-binding domain-containing protein [Clostridia bacterium]